MLSRTRNMIRVRPALCARITYTHGRRSLPAFACLLVYFLVRLLVCLLAQRLERSGEIASTNHMCAASVRRVF